MMREKFSVVIITKNEEKFISDAISSALFADEIVILDSGSTDRTKEISKSLNVKFYFSTWEGFGPQKNKAIGLAKNSWVFVLDSDERISEDLQEEILENLVKPSAKGFLVPRLNNFFGKNIKTCGLYPDYSIRLFNKNYGKFNDVPVHESVSVNGKVEKLNSPLIHFAYENVSEFRKKQNLYASLHQSNKSFIRAILSSIWAFIKIYFLKFGIVEGWRGLVIASVYAKYSFDKYKK